MAQVESFDDLAVADLVATTYFYARQSAAAVGSRDKRFALPASIRSFFGLTAAANKLVYGNGAGLYELTDFTAFARTLLDDANAPTARATLGFATATATLNFNSINAAASEDLTITVTGAVAGDAVHLGLPAAVESGMVFQGFVSAADTVTVRGTNVTGSPINPASATFRATVIKSA